MLPETAAQLVIKILDLVIKLLDGVPVEQRRAQAIAWFWTWWPVSKIFLKKEQEEQIEKIMRSIGEPPQ